MLTIEQPNKKMGIAVLQRGFRPFFAAAMGFASVAIFTWLLLYFGFWELPAGNYLATQWHAHEMIYGFASAVAAGFLLTAIQNWTGIKTLHGTPLLLLFLLWLVARLLPLLLSSSQLWLLALFDLSFGLWLAIATTLPIVKARQWNNIAFSGKMIFLFIANAIFYLGLLGNMQEARTLGLYMGFYLILALILTMGRRIIPFFIEKGVSYPFKPKNWQWLDIANLILFTLFSITELFYSQSSFNSLFVSLLLVLNSVRLYGWYTHGIWKKPLLWSLYLGYAWLVVGFLLKLLSLQLLISPYLAIHSFAYGGMGLITVGMMARVALGHTGHNVFDPPKILFWIYSLLFIGAIVRVILPLLIANMYPLWILVSQIMWITAFAVLFVLYLPILFKPNKT